MVQGFPNSALTNRSNQLWRYFQINKLNEVGVTSKKFTLGSFQCSAVPKGTVWCRKLGRIWNYALGGGPCLGLIYAWSTRIRVHTRVVFLLGKARGKYSKSQNLHVFFKQTPQEAKGALRRAKKGPMSHIWRENDGHALTSYGTK